FGSTYFVKEGSNASVDIFAGKSAEEQIDVHLNFLLILLTTIIISVIAGILIGLPTLRLRGDYIAIVTLAFGEIIRVVATNGEDIKLPFGSDAYLTAGRQGITPID